MREPDQERWLTYAEAAALLGISTEAARMLARRHGWPRRSPNAYGGRARVLLHDDMARDRERPASTGGRMTGQPDGHDRANEELVRVFDRAVCALQQQLDRADQQIDGLHADLASLRVELSDARAAERISADSAAALRHELEMLRVRPWWRRWFR